MKKLLIVLLLSFTLTFGIVHAESTGENVYQKVFKLKSYYYDEDYKTFLYYSFGSATLIEKNKILTNAHVVLDDDNEILGKYSLCQTHDFKKEPKCFSKLKLLSYDIGLDLAVLEILDNTESLPSPIKISNNQLNIGDNVTAYGYPGNGGDTITLTQGKISGFDSPFYKIDANLDGGSSGGALLDSEDNFVGVPSAVSYGDTTLGEVIPSSNVKIFLENQEVNQEVIEYYLLEDEDDKQEYEKFNTFIDAIHKEFSYNYIDTGFIKINNLSKYGFRLSDIDIYDYQDDFESKDYTLTSDSGNTNVYIDKNYALGNIGFTYKDGRNMLKMMERSIDEEQKKKGKYKKNIYKKIKIKGEEVIMAISFDVNTKDINFNFSSSQGIGISIDSNLKYKKEINKSLIMIIKGFERVKDFNNTREKLDYFGAQIKNTKGFEFEKGYNRDSQEFQLIGISEGYKSNVEGYNLDYAIVGLNYFYYNEGTDFSEVTLEKFADSLKDNNFFMPGYETKEILLTKTYTNKFLYLNAIEETSGFNIYGFVTFSEVEDEKRAYIFTIMTPTKNSEIEAKIENLINNISIDGEEFIITEDEKKIKYVEDIF